MELASVVADLIREGHRPKYIAFVLNDRTELQSNDIAALLSSTRRAVMNDISRIRLTIQRDNTRTERLWQGCDAAFVALMADQKRDAA